MKKENRTEFIIVRVSSKEKEMLKKRAGDKFSKYIRSLLGLEE